MKKADHLTEEQFSRYQRRTLEPAELLDVDQHIAQCEECLARLWRESGSVPALRDLRSQLSEHLDYDQIVACAEGTSSTAWEQHLAECDLCRTEVSDLRQFRTELSTASQTAKVIAMPARKTSWRLPAYAAIAAGTVLVAGLSFWALRKQSQPIAPPVQTAKTLQPVEPALLPEQQAAVDLALATGKLGRAPVLGRLIAKRGVLLGAPAEARTFEIGSPMGTTVLSDRPAFRWQPVEGAKKYVVSVFDADFREVAESPALTSAVWQPEQSLARGRIYYWQVTATVGGSTLRAPMPPAPEARFQVVRDGEAVEIESARRDHPGNHLLLAVLMANAGALDDAAVELDALAATDAATAQTLRESLNGIRKR
jgi:hypothetical protein